MKNNILNNGKPENLPKFLTSFEDLIGHFDEHFGELGSSQRGDTFLDLAQKIIPLTPEGESFPTPMPNNKKSHDGGIDLLSSETDDNRILYAQSKYKIREKEAFDSIISKFYNFESTIIQKPKNPDLFDDLETKKYTPASHYFIVTSSKLSEIIKKYETSSLSSKSFYETLKKERRLIIIDGPKILIILQQLYKKTHLVPSNITLTSSAGWVSKDGVWLGAVKGSDIAMLYKEHGDALFFENVRDFLGVTSGKVVTTRSTVNQEIILTIKNQPEKMISRNNGITFRASGLSPNSPTEITLSMAAIVNGCQTTMCLVQCDPIPENCSVQVKVVETDDAWDIAMAANYQNPIARVDLDLARYLRPQLVRRVAMNLGYAVASESEVSASTVLNTIYRNKIEYDELKLLYLGLFSRKPNNLFDANYTELRSDILSKLYDNTENEEKIFSVLLLILKESKTALDRCQQAFNGPEYSSLFRRFYNDEKPRYRAFVAVAAIAAALRDDISRRSQKADEEIERVLKFFSDARYLLENHSEKYRRSFLYAFEVLADSALDVSEEKNEADIAQRMFQKISKMAFESLHKRILMKIDREKDFARLD